VQAGCLSSNDTRSGIILGSVIAIATALGVTVSLDDGLGRFFKWADTRYTGEE